MTAGHAVEVRAVSRAIGDRLVLDGIELAVARGEVFGLIGRNGAGKSTLIECIVGLQAPTAGRVSVLGLRPMRDRAEITRRVAVQTQTGALLPTLTVLETIELFASFYDRTRGIATVVDAMGLDAVTAARVGHLSGGESRRLQIALALLPYADVVVLDEPSAAVDPEGRDRIHAAIAALAASGVTVLLSTHDMTEAEEWCDRVAVLDRGRLRAVGAPAELVREHDGHATVSFSRSGADLAALRAAVMDRAAGDHGSLAEAPRITSTQGRIRIETQDVDALVRRLTFARDVRLVDLAIERRGLSALYFD